MTVEEKIIGILKDNNIAYEVFQHEPVYTNPTMAAALNVSESETVKSLVVMTKEKEMVVLVMPGDKKVEWKKAAAGIGTRYIAADDAEFKLTIQPGQRKGRGRTGPPGVEISQRLPALHGRRQVK